MKHVHDTPADHHGHLHPGSAALSARRLALMLTLGYAAVEAAAGWWSVRLHSGTARVWGVPSPWRRWPAA
jgi:hypothetical protein